MIESWDIKLCVVLHCVCAAYADCSMLLEHRPNSSFIYWCQAEAQLSYMSSLKQRIEPIKLRNQIPEFDEQIPKFRKYKNGPEL